MNMTSGRGQRRAFGLGAVAAALAAATALTPVEGTLAGWSDTIKLGDVAFNFAAVDFAAAADTGTPVVPAKIGDQVTVTLPDKLLEPLADPASKGVAMDLKVSGYAQGTQAIYYGIAAASGTNGYADVDVKVIDAGTNACTPSLTGTTLASGTGLGAVKSLPEQKLDDAVYSTSTTPTVDHLCMIFTRPTSWSSNFTTTTTATGTADAGTSYQTTVTATSAPWTATVDRTAASVNGTGSVTLSWSVKGS